MRVNSHQDNSDAFLKLSFKQSLSHLNRLISSRASYVFFKTLEHSPAPKNLKTRAKDLAHFQNHKITRTVEGKKVFGKYLVQYGMNMEKAKTLRKPASDEKLNSATKKAIKAARHVPLKNSLKVTRKIDGPVCYAASMNCIKQYLDLRKSGIDESKAFSKATGLQKNGISEEVVLVRSLTRKVEPKYLKRDDYKARLKAKDRIFSKFFGFHFGHHSSGTRKNFNKDFLNTAPPGTYLMNLMDSQWQTGHSMVIVKNMDKSLFIYDPNFGAAIVPKEDAKSTLKRLFNHSYYKNLDNLIYSPAVPRT